MELLGRQEIYIPADAEVKRISLRSLPKSVLRRIGLSQSDSDGSRKLADSEGTWICPAVLRQRGQEITSNRGNNVVEMSSKLAKEFRAAPGPFQMSFVCSSRAAYRVLSNTSHGENVPADTSFTSVLSADSAPHTYQVAVVIFQGRVYLSIRKPSQSQRQGGTREPQPAAQSPIPSTSNGSSESQKKQPAPKASLKAADKRPPKKRLRITLPSKSLKLKLSNKTGNPSTTDKDNRPERTCVQHKGATHNRGEVSTPQAAAIVRPPSVRGHRLMNCHHHDAGGEQAAENGAAWLQEEDSNSVRETQELGGAVQSTSQNSNMVTDIQVDSDNGDTGVQSHSRTETQSASSSLQQECDFKELAQEERIAKMMEKLRQREAALKNLNPS